MIMGVPLFAYVSQKFREIYRVIVNTNSSQQSFSRQGQEYKIHFLSLYRVFVLLTTFICILAVDFSIFPRRFAKSEDYGLSFMDIGVGAFVLCNALVSSEAKKTSHPPLNTAGFDKSHRSCSLKPALILFSIGLARTILIKVIGYHEHVTEYGSHWNFFITLSLLKVFGPLIDRCTLISWYFGKINANSPLKICDAFVNFGIFIYLQHLLINLCNLQNLFEIDIYSQRSIDTIFMANREGILSFPGYVAIYLFGIAIGKIIFLLYRSSPMKCFKYLMFILLVFGLICTPYIKNTNLHISRKMCNAPYIHIICFINLFILVIFLITMAFVKTFLITDEKDCRINGSPPSWDSALEDINKNGLVLFLVANIFTGFVNLLIDTQLTSGPVSILIIFAYMCIILSINFLGIGKRILFI